MNEFAVWERYFITDRRYLPLDGIAARENIESAAYTLTPQAYPQTPYLDTPVLEFAGKPCAGNVPKSVELPLPRGCAQNADTFSVAVNGRGTANRMALTAVFADGEQKRAEFSFAAERWNRLTADWQAFAGGKEPKRLFLSFYNSDCPQESRDFIQLDELFFGNLFDLSFRKGNAVRFLRADANIRRTPHGMIWRFSEGDVLRFPALDKPRYSLLNCVFGVQDTAWITAKGEGTLALRLSADTSPDEYAEIPLALPAQKASVPVDIAASGFAAGSRLYGMEWAAQTDGFIEVYAIEFTQEHGDWGDDGARLFAQSEPMRLARPFVCPTRPLTVCVTECGATGNGRDDDTAAINAAIVRAHKAGGGTVTIPEGRYRATHIVLQSGVTLHLAKGALLLQSDRAEDYPYQAVFGHDSPTSSLDWPHNFLVSNRPLLYADGQSDIAVTGQGAIRMCDGGCERTKVGFPYWPIHCGGVIHTVPIGLNDCRNVRIEGITVNRASSYHLFLCDCEHVAIDGVKLYDVRCLSADGIGLACCKRVRIANSVIVTNDDGITLSPMYRDPRSGGWWRNTPGRDNSVRDIEIAHCYIQSGYGGGGKAIAFIPWGTCAPDQSLQQIDGVYVHDCILDGGHSVGTWCDNPYHGRRPFDNAERDDYSPVKNVRIRRNEYRAPADLLWMQVTDLYSDAGLYSAPQVINGDFALGGSNWNASGNVRFEKGACFIENGAIRQGIRLHAGKHRILFRVAGEGAAAVGEKRVPFARMRRSEVPIEADCPQDTDVQICVRSDTRITVYGVESMPK